uniref:Uncharacterized protein n=1 Tax=Arundo donax TaxID=35708 RepID=A0A0A9EN57_ARUDO
MDLNKKQLELENLSTALTFYSFIISIFIFMSIHMGTHTPSNNLRPIGVHTRSIIPNRTEIEVKSRESAEMRMGGVRT